MAIIKSFEGPQALSVQSFFFHFNLCCKASNKYHFQTSLSSIFSKLLLSLVGLKEFLEICKIRGVLWVKALQLTKKQQFNCSTMQVGIGEQSYQEYFIKKFASLSFTIHHYNIQMFCIELYKVYHNLSQTFCYRKQQFL